MDSYYLFDELERSLPLLQALTAGISTDDSRQRTTPDDWSALEVVCHLYDEEREDFRQRLEIMLQSPQEPLPPIDPQGWVTARAYNQRDLGEMVEKWTEERTRSLAWLRGLETPDWEAQYTSPFGSMRAGDMLAAWAAHDNLHIRQLVELRYNRLLRLAAPYEAGYAGEW